MKTYRLITVSLVILLFSSPLYAQWFVEANGGYILPRNPGHSSLHYNQNIEQELYTETDPEVTEEKIQFSVLESFTFGLGGGYKLNNFEFSLGVMYSSNLSNQNLNNNQIETHRNYHNSTLYYNYNFTYDEYWEFYQRSLIIQPGIKYNFNLGKFRISPFADFSFHFIQLHQHNSNFFEEGYYPEREGSIYREYVYEPKKNLSDIFNPEAGVQFEYQIHPKFSIWMNTSVSILEMEASYTEKEMTTEKYSGDGKEFESLIVFSEQTPFTANLSNIKTNIGFRYYFNNK